MRSFQELEEEIDLSILSLPVSHKLSPDLLEGSVPNPQKQRFWGPLLQQLEFGGLRGHWVPLPRIKLTLDALQIREYKLIDDKRLQELMEPYSIIREPKVAEFDWKLMGMLKECTPQFTLRNIGRVESSVDLALPPPFKFEEPPLREANRELAKAKELDFPRPDMLRFWSAELLSDFNIFLEELFHLCLWEEIPGIKGFNPQYEGTSWDPKHSKSQLTFDMVERFRSGGVFVFGQKGGPILLQRRLKKAKHLAKVVNARLPEPTENTEPTEEHAEVHSEQLSLDEETRRTADLPPNEQEEQEEQDSSNPSNEDLDPNPSDDNDPMG